MALLTANKRKSWVKSRGETDKKKVFVFFFNQKLQNKLYKRETECFLIHSRLQFHGSQWQSGTTAPARS